MTKSLSERDANKDGTTMAVAQRASAALALPTDGVAGLTGSFGKGDITIPICSLAQLMSQNKGEAGKFYFPDGRSLDMMQTVVLDIVATRAMWAPISESLEGPLCKSADRVYGIPLDAARVLEGEVLPGYQEGDPIPCARCPHYGDAETFTEDKTRLLCRNGYTLLMVDFETDAPFLFFVKGSAVKPVKQRIVSPALMRFKRTGKAEPWAQVYDWTAKLVEQPGKKFYTPEIMPSTELDDAAKDYYAAMSADLRGRAGAQTIETPESLGQQELSS